MDLENKSNTQFDKELNKVKANYSVLNFLPWVGKEYAEAKNKIFIIAESIYGDWNTDKNASRIIIDEHAIKELFKKSQLWKNINRIICEKKTTPEIFWNKVCFNNLVQVRMVDRSYRPSKNDYAIGVDYIKQQIDILKPELVLCCIGRNYVASMFKEKFSNSKLEEEKNKINGVIPRILTSNKLKILFIKHASSFFSCDQWHKFINKYARANVEFFQNLSVN